MITHKQQCMVTVNPCFSSVTEFLKLLCYELSVQTGNKADMWLRICDKLKGERKVIIIDEAQHLPIKTLETIRSFFDVYSEIGVCLIGNIETYTNTGKSKEAFAQIKNRTKLTEIRHTSHITKEDILLLFPLLKDEKAIDFMLKIARSIEGVRGCENLYSNADGNENITLAGLVAVAKQCMHITTGGV